MRHLTHDAPQIVCPHCQVRGRVRTKKVARGEGFSGNKLVLAFFTLGLSLPFAGLSDTRKRTKMTCGNCKMTWWV